MLHPIEVAAWGVEQRSHAFPVKERFDLSAKDLRGGEPGAVAAGCLRIPPIICQINLAEYLPRGPGSKYHSLYSPFYRAPGQLPDDAKVGQKFEHRVSPSKTPLGFATPFPRLAFAPPPAISQARVADIGVVAVEPFAFARD
jgi:hypothetical protein